MFRLLHKLYQANLISPKGLYYLIQSFVIEGINLLSILRFIAKTKPYSLAIIDSKRKMSYYELYETSYDLAILFQNKYEITDDKKVAIICRNHIEMIQSIFALSKLGSDIVLLNIEMSFDQLKKIIDSSNFDLIIYDDEKESDLSKITLKHKLLAFHKTKTSIKQLLINSKVEKYKLRKVKSSSITVLSGGSTGEFKSAKRKPSISNFLNPFFALLTKVNIHKYNSVYIAPPIYHGYGLAALIISIILGKEIFVIPKYKTDLGASIIDKNKIEVAIVVPLMLKRLLNQHENDLSSLQCILSGGAILDEKLIEQSNKLVGPILFNLYGTSEAGFSILATPYDLEKHPLTIGKKIKGVSIKITNSQHQIVENGEIGMICLKSNWIMESKGSKWIPTGDLGYANNDNYIFLKGRIDNMIISGGENVYPEEIEKILLQNEQIINAVVISIDDDDFGKRLKAFVVISENSILTEDLILKWLTTKVSRFQMPSKIKIINEIPMFSTGKIDKSKLLN